MKYAPRLYAQALIELIEKKETKQIAENLIALLKKNGDLKHLPQIIHVAERELVRHDGGRAVVLETARPMSDLKKKLHAFLTPHDIIEEKVNPELIAGFRITVDGNSQIDASLKTQLDQLFQTHRR